MTREVTHPSHYTRFRIEPIHATEEWHLGYHLGNCIKYIARYQYKSVEPEAQLKDLLKAKWFLDRFIKLKEKELASEKSSRNKAVK